MNLCSDFSEPDCLQLAPSVRPQLAAPARPLSVHIKLRNVGLCGLGTGRTPGRLGILNRKI